jgi:hypothetical protein
VIQSCISLRRRLNVSIILFLIRNFSGKGIKFKGSILVHLRVLIGKNIGLSMLSAIIKIVRRSILDKMRPRVHNLLIFVHGSKRLRNEWMIAYPNGLIHGRRCINRLFKNRLIHNIYTHLFPCAPIISKNQSQKMRIGEFSAKPAELVMRVIAILLPLHIVFGL